MSNSVKCFNQNDEISQKFKGQIKSQTGSNEYYKYYIITEKERISFIMGLKNKLKHLMMSMEKQKRLQPSEFWGQTQDALNKSLVQRNKTIEENVRKQTDQIQLNLQVIINRSDDTNIIKNRYLIKSHIAESTFSNTYRVNQRVYLTKVSRGSAWLDKIKSISVKFVSSSDNITGVVGVSSLNTKF